MADHGTFVEKETVAPKRLTFVCSRCNAASEAPPNTNRAKFLLCRVCFGRRADMRPRELNDLTGAEWAKRSKSVETYPDVRSEKQRIHGACFPKSLALQQIEIFTKAGETVLDPFVGVGTTLDAAMELGRNGIGIDLNGDFLRMARKNVKNKLGTSQRLLKGDARRLSKLVEPASVDFILTSPPYAGLLKSIKGNFAYKWREHSTLNPISNPKPYSANKRDLGNLPYDKFMTAIGEVMGCTYEVLKPNAYAVWVVKDYRDVKNGKPYINFHGDVIAEGDRAGLTLWDIRIYDQTKFRPLVCLGFPSRNFYLNIGHSYLLTFKKSVMK